MILAVIDTNVLVSALMTKHSDAATIRVIYAVAQKLVVPLYNDAIFTEYREVLSRKHFRFDEDKVAKVLNLIESTGIDIDAKEYLAALPDEKDRIFFEVALAGQDDDAKLVTGNLKHFPSVPFVVTPAQLCELIGI